MINKLITASLLLSLISAVATGVAIKESPYDQRIYALIELENGLPTLLISDAKTTKAAAALRVGSGSLEDDPEALGLAHFTEHMLFLGTEKYPDAGEYSRYISLHNGRSNAFTSSEATVYYFSITPSALAGGLDRFSQFFISPNFDQDLVQRELNAIDSEHSANLANDFRIRHEVSKILFDRDYPGHRFATGNHETLKNTPELRAKLLDFYQHHYTSQNMHLVILGRESIPKLTEYAELYFSSIVDHPIEKQTYDQVFDQSKLGTLISIKSISETKNLRLFFPLPPLKENYREKPISYISDLLGEESPGSLTDVLKKQDLATSLSAGGFAGETYSTIGLEIGLTDKGAEDLTRIIKMVFTYIDQIKKQEPQAWRFAELNQASLLNFHYKDKEQPESYVVTMVTGMSYYPPADLLQGPYIFDDYNPRLIKDLLAKITPENMYAVYLNPEVEGDKTEPWYKASYSIRQFDKEELADFENKTQDEFQLPLANSYLPKSTNLKPVTDKSKKPQRLVKDETLDFWFLQEPYIRLPQGWLRIQFDSPIANLDSQSALKRWFLADIWLEQLNASLYSAAKIGMNYNISANQKGLALQIAGFNDSIEPILDEFIATINRLKLDEQIFTAKKEQIADELQNKQLSNALRIGIEEYRHLQFMGNWHYQALLSALDEISFAEVVEFGEQFLAEGKIEAYLQGNFTLSEAEDFAAKIKSAWNLKAVDPEAIEELRITKFEPGTKNILKNSINNDSAVVAVLQAEERSFRTSALALMLDRFIQEPFFSSLRTEQQLGYVVEFRSL